MDFLPILVLMLLASVVVVALLGLRLRRAWRAREEHRRASAELTHRQLTELRVQQDQMAGAVQQIEERLSRHLEPRLAFLERQARLDALAVELERGVERGRLGEETAQRLTLEIAQLGIENAATDGIY